jgi:hypothetical protein
VLAVAGLDQGGGMAGLHAVKTFVLEVDVRQTVAGQALPGPFLPELMEKEGLAGASHSDHGCGLARYGNGSVDRALSQRVTQPARCSPGPMVHWPCFETFILPKKEIAAFISPSGEDDFSRDDWASARPVRPYTEHGPPLGSRLLHQVR